MTNLRRRHRALAAAYLAQAAVLLAQPPAVLRVIVGGHDVPPSWIVRVLGIRTLAQGLVEITRPNRRLLRVGVAVDLTHAASMLAAARVWPAYRRAALISAGSAAVSAIVGGLNVQAPNDRTDSRSCSAAPVTALSADTQRRAGRRKSSR
jgi:hypothetical protein